MINLEIFEDARLGSKMECVDMKDIHEGLECKTDYSTWVKRKIQKYKLVEGIDYVNYPRTKDSWASDFNGLFALRTDQPFSWFRLRLIVPSLRIIGRPNRCRFQPINLQVVDFLLFI